MGLLRRIAVLSAIASTAVMAQNSEDNTLISWAQSYPESIDGVIIYPPHADENSIKISDIADFADRNQERIYVNTLLDIASNADGTVEAVDNNDVTGKRLKVKRQVPAENGAVTYSYSVAFQMADDMLSFLIYDISISYREKGIMPRTQSIEKLKPQENRRHKELIDGFVFEASAYIGRIKNAITRNDAGAVSHWDYIEKGQVVKGMNPTEVMMVRGKPSSSRQTGKRLKWMYGNDHVVVFTDDIVTTVL